MPTYEYKCPGIYPGTEHTFSWFFKSLLAANVYLEYMPCMEHDQIAERIWSKILGFGLYGKPDGYYKPSLTKGK